MRGDAAAKWLAATTSIQARQNYINGVNAVQVSPMQKAADAQDAYLRGVQQAVNDGTYKRGMAKSSLQDWKQKSGGKGADRLATGAQAAAPKMVTHFQQHGQVYDQAAAAAAALPKGGKANAMARVSAVYDIMKTGFGKQVT